MTTSPFATRCSCLSMLEPFATPLPLIVDQSAPPFATRCFVSQLCTSGSRSTRRDNSFYSSWTTGSSRIRGNCGQATHCCCSVNWCPAGHLTVARKFQSRSGRHCLLCLSCWHYLLCLSCWALHLYTLTLTLTLTLILILSSSLCILLVVMMRSTEFKTSRSALMLIL